MKRRISHNGGLILKGYNRRHFLECFFVATIINRIKASENKGDVISELEIFYSTNKLSLDKSTDAVKKKN